MKTFLLITILIVCNLVHCSKITPRRQSLVTFQVTKHDRALQRVVSPPAAPKPISMTLTPDQTKKNGDFISSNPTNLYVKSKTGEWKYQNDHPVMAKINNSVLKFEWKQDPTLFATLKVVAFSPNGVELNHATLDVNGKRKREIEIKGEDKGRTTIEIELSPVPEIEHINVGTLTFTEGKDIIYIHSIEVILQGIDSLKAIYDQYENLRKRSYDSSVRLLNAMYGARTIINGIASELESHQLRTRVAKSTGNTILIAGAISAQFSLGVSLIVTGAIGGVLNIGANINDHIVSKDQGEKIKRAMTDLREYNSDFYQKFRAFQGFLQTLSKKMNVEITFFMGAMSNIKRFGSGDYKGFDTFRDFKTTYAMFDALKSGQSLQTVVTTFNNASGTSMMANTAHKNVSPVNNEAKMWEKASQFLEPGIDAIDAVLHLMGPIKNIMNIVMTWMTTNPTLQDAQAQIKALDDGIKNMSTYIDSIKPGRRTRNVLRALALKGKGKVSVSAIRRLKKILVASSCKKSEVSSFTSPRRRLGIY